MERIPTIDAFRGLAIVGMVLFTLLTRLGTDLPPLLKHNVPGEFHIGDLVFPFFLFASGMSLVFFAAKRIKDPKGLVLDSIEREAKLLGVGYGFSIFSVGRFLGLDEFVLNAVLFPMALLLTTAPIAAYALISLVVFVGYWVIQSTIGLGIFDQAYLGGYPGAIFYLPVMLGGMVLAQQIKEGRLQKGRMIQTVMVLLVATVILIMLFFFPVDKMRVSPSFMLVSIILAIAVYWLLERASGRWIAALEYLGRHPLRYWSLMYLLFIIPHTFCYGAGKCPAVFNFAWSQAILIAAAWLVILAAASLGIDKIMKNRDKGLQAQI